jgi:hypothetical protein
MKFLLLILACCLHFSMLAQPCKPTFNPSIFNPNKIHTGFNPNGSKFVTMDHAGLVVPYPENPHASTISVGNLWIASRTNGQLYMAGQTYFTPIHYDFTLGPLGSDGELLTDVCNDFNRTWVVNREDIIRHHIDFTIDGQINQPLQSIYGWPGEGNDFFEAFNGFPLPVGHEGGWADFVDKNNNGKYEPSLGEYPAVQFQGDTIVPDQFMWMVFNDKGQHLESNGRPLGVEIQFTVFGFYCENNELLSHSLFNSYKIINQQGTRLDSVYFGFFHDYELGCEEYDDYIGSDSVRHAEFVYNSAPNKEAYCGYGAYPPVQSMMYLSHPMYSFINVERMNPPQTDLEYYRYLTGHWRNGNPMYTAGNGMQPVSGSRFTRFLFHGDPRNAAEWSEVAVQSPEEDRRTVSSVFLGNLSAGESARVESVYAFHQDSSLQHLALFGAMYSQLDALRSISGELHQHCQPFPLCVDGDCVWPGDFNHDGIADHRDLLYWSVMKGSTGATRNGLISWRGHFAEEWSISTPDQLNYKHGDATGNGVVDYFDLYLHYDHFGFVDPNKPVVDHYPTGDDLLILSQPMDADGDIDDIRIVVGTDIPEIYGLSFELEYDTFLFEPDLPIVQQYPFDSQGLHFNEDIYTSGTAASSTIYSAAGSNGENVTLPANTQLIRIPFGIDNKHHLPLQLLPDTIHLRLKNLVGVDRDGRDLQLGAFDLKVPNALMTASNEPLNDDISLYPNPVREKLYIHGGQIESVTIFTATGLPVMQLVTDTQEAYIDVSALPSGLYYLQLSGSGRVGRFVKE